MILSEITCPGDKIDIRLMHQVKIEENGGEMAQVYKSGICDYLSDSLLDLWEVLKNCDHIYTIVREDPLATAKIEQYEKALESMQYGDIASKTRKWELPVFRKLPLQFEELTYGDLAGYIKKEVFPDLFGAEQSACR